ncbi:MAG: 4-alpha-glucanotransferase [Bacillota bacterium]|nr:4-alpha-glucanotransferase [Bacillota bacterium]
MERSAGILLHVTSLPGPFGIGTMGQEARDFIDRLSEAGIGWWQVLPLTQPAEDNPRDNSPYKCYSTFAGNTWLCDPREIEEELGLLEEHELRDYMSFDDGYLTDYAFVHSNSQRYLGQAFSRLDEDGMREVQDFLKSEDWLLDYAIFRCIREELEGLPWWEWPDDLKRRDPATLARFREEHEQQINFIAFGQWVFRRQWLALRAYANERGVRIFGDLPFYVSDDSSDVWTHPELFALNEKLEPEEVAGVPPDYFSADGQRWGNTLYDWDAMRADGYGWWIRRIEHAHEIYDRLRIDHFRALASYWAIPATSETAREGSWRPGPGMELLEAVRAALGDVDIVAEDLGGLSDDVHKLLADSGYPGMQVLQFSLSPGDYGTSRPHRWKANSCAYTGTHDNDTLFGWLWNTNEEERRFALEYVGFPEEADWRKGGSGSPVCRAFVRMLWASVADFACVPIQDLLGFGSDTRMNVPGQPEDCWRFRVTQYALEGIDFAWLADLGRIYDRHAGIQAARSVETAESL